MIEKYFDLLVIGGGMGGYSAALRAKEYGKSVAIIEADKIGGTCLNRGCIPTKAFLHIAKQVNTKNILKNNKYKQSDEPDYPEIVEQKIREKVSTLQKGLSNTLKVGGIEVFNGRAVAKGENIIGVVEPELWTKDDSNCDQLIRYGHLIIATGSKPFVPSGIMLGECVFTTDDAFSASNMEFDSIAVVGGGVIGVEFASIYADLGKEVTIIEPLNVLISGFSKEVSKFVRAYLQRKGVIIKTSTSVSHISEEDGEVYIELSNNHVAETMLCDKALICTGRCANIDETLIAKLGIIVSDGLIGIDQNNLTSNDTVYAVGDVCSSIQLAYTASREGETVVDYLYGTAVATIDHVPQCVYMDVEVAQVGFVIDCEENDDYIAEKYFLKSNGRAVLEGRTNGFIRMTAKKETGVLVGVEMITPNAVDDIQLCKVFVDKGFTVLEVAEMLYPHPSFIETIKDCARLLLKKINGREE